MSVSLQLRAGAGHGERRAWFVAGVQPSTWLVALQRLGGNPATVVVLPVPSSPTDHTPCGAVLVWPTPFAPHDLGAALPWQIVAGCVALPVDTQLWPPVEDAELRTLLPAQWLVWHPAIGPIGFASDDLRTVAELVSLPARAAAWDRARPGQLVVSELRSVRPFQMPSTESMFAEERDEIGNERLPGLSSPRALASQPSNLPARLLARLVLLLTKLSPPTAQQPTWVNRLEDWAHARLAKRRTAGPRQSAVDQTKRERALEGLVRMLNDDPARGLRFALPLAGLPGRGRAAPTNELIARATDFDPRGLAGGGTVDAWEVPDRLQLELHDLYRQLAASEREAGRHRRAAYIHAHLRGDLRTAAALLKEGRFFREAALVYRKQLEDPAAASQCLVAGGLLDEAAALELELGNFERVGDLRLLLGQNDLARAAYEQAHGQLLAAAEHVPAALLAAEKLFDVDGALTALAARWQRFGERDAFAAWLALHRRLDQLPLVERELERLDDRGPMARQPGFASVLGAFATLLPAGALRDLVRDRVAMAAADCLPTAPAGTRRQLLKALRLAGGDDPLLASDVVRWSRQNELRPVPPAPSSLVRRWQALGRFGDSPRAVTLDRELYYIDDGGYLVRRSLEASGRDQRGPQPFLFPNAVKLMAGAGRVACLVGFPDHSHEVHLAAPDRWPATPWQGGRLRRAICVAYAGGGGLVAALDDGVGTLVDRFDDKGISSAAPVLAAADENNWQHLVTRGNYVLVAGRTRGCVLCVPPFGPREHIATFDAPEPIRSVVAAPEGEGLRVAIGLEHGLLLIDIASGAVATTQQLAPELHQPTVGWNRLGKLIAVDGERVKIAAVEPGLRLRWIDERYGAGQPALILPTTAPDEVVFVASQTLTCLSVR